MCIEEDEDEKLNRHIFRTYSHVEVNVIFILKSFQRLILSISRFRLMKKNFKRITLKRR
jgi:hypothetical protein